MAAGEDQAQAVLRNRRILLRGRQLEMRRDLLLVCARLAPQCSRSIALCRPAETSQLTGFAGVPATSHCSNTAANAAWSLLCHVDVAEEADQRGQDPPTFARKTSSMRLAAWREGHPTGRRRHATGYRGGQSAMGRTSIAWRPARTPGCRAASEIASSTLSASTRL
jgi:hypothetical protein